ncbi:MAG: DUF2997 domain-containing protein [Planctomycetota bacterium]|nr:MAG: DUF2997 domain-containing protein [Planctomycetota bacterium]REK25962.1 MAG: DUF2997 domain-containing protein [Planctomycetota bacterium]REK46922.1 MAG: DUF2997 domain-containing protein [Planctomycetota bacterium]
MELQEIDVFIDEKGEVRIEVRGVKGNSCLEITKDLEAALGGQIVNREMTPEALEESQQRTDDQQWLSGS